MFTRQVVGTAMAISGGWGASGAGFSQLFVGSILYPLSLSITSQDTNMAWRLSLIVPALLAMYVALFFLKKSDDCPLGSYKQVKRAGLMMERSAVDSFRSGAMNVNSWLLFLQFAGSCGVDLTMCNGTAIYYHEEFRQPIAAAGAIAFLYGISSIYARGLGGYVSDALGDAYSLRGRLVAQMCCMIVQGIVCIWFSRVKSLGMSIFAMFIFSILIQVSSFVCWLVYVCRLNARSVCSVASCLCLGMKLTTSAAYSYSSMYTLVVDVHGNMFWHCQLRRWSQYRNSCGNSRFGWKRGRRMVGTHLHDP